MRQLTINGFALGEVIVLRARQERVSVPTDYTLDISGGDVKEETLRHDGSNVY